VTRYLPDTMHLIRFGRGRRDEVEWFQMMLNSGEEVGACPVTIAEVYAGAPPREFPGWKEIFDTLVYWDVTREDAVQSGIYRYDWARRGFQLKLGDTLIAAVAKRVGATVVTENLKDFPMDDFPVIPLRTR
jgi:tRNA(fMet)-specific endonuclease VapC